MESAAADTIRDLAEQARVATERMGASNPNRALLVKLTSMMLSLGHICTQAVKRVGELERAAADKPRIVLP